MEMTITEAFEYADRWSRFSMRRGLAEACVVLAEEVREQTIEVEKLLKIIQKQRSMMLKLAHVIS